ncbi:helix-turn-helix domain-containing protein [Wenzhouxiangella sp. XN24]|uniref:GlxA family transcriptional regulator n=1 Tax=Wenzhouxiangella sp. XN24 TaxID=2713569 RepID=UPI0013ECA63D|nr:helix-turn-helix domain-containing protein [Wenzhouxiangella sp. XN24]NGX16663.1 helix-turn-helix domain-containing protein [Wenzhouxiangella sp. XN24]
MQEPAPSHSRRIAMLGFDGVQVLDVAGPLEVFSCASRLLQRHGLVVAPAYETLLLARHDGPLTSSSGLAFIGARPWETLGTVDTLLVAGGAGVRDALRERDLLDWLPRGMSLARRFGSVCSGALLLARAGLLERRSVTTHWAFLRELTALAPTARIDPDAVYVRDGELWTSAGVTAGMDMALAMVEEDWGRKLANEVAEQLVMYLKRPAAPPQISVLLAAGAGCADGRFRSLATWLVQHLDEDLSIEALAARMGMSTRHFSRCFVEEFGVTPKKFVERARYEAARSLLADADLSLQRIASVVGLGNPENLRRLFLRREGIGPAAYRARLRSEAAESRESHGDARL